MARAIVHFEIFATDIERAKRFYETVFGWKIEQWGDQDYWNIYTGRGTYPDGQPAGIDGGLVRRKGAAPFAAAPANAFVCTMEVDDLDASLQAVQDARGRVTVPRTPIGDMGWYAHCQDTEGNLFGMLQSARRS